VRYYNKTHAAPTGDVMAAATDYVKNAPELTGDGDDWKIRSSAKDMDGLDHVRMAQIHDGVVVFGADIVVHSDATKFGTVQGTIVKNLAGFDITPSLDAQNATSLAKMDYTSKAKDQSAHLKFAREASDLVILPRKGRDARLAWHITFFTELQGGMPAGLWNYFVDAKTGSVLQHFNALDTVDQASGPGGNPKFVHSWNMELDVTPAGTLFAMDTDRLQTVDMHMTTDDTMATIVNGPIDNISDAAIDDAHGYAEVTLNMLNDWQGYNSIDNMGFKIKSRVHYDVAYENAFWDGTQMTYGDGASLFYPLSGSVDVVAHEIDHGFTSFHSNLTYSGMSGGMNESFSDIAGKTAEWYYVPADANFDLGGNIFKQAGQALRYMCDPPKDGASIDNAANYSDSLDVHYTSGVMNKAFCRAAKRLSAGGDPDGTADQDGVKRASRAWYLANAQYWTASSTFIQGCQGVMDAATALMYSPAELDAIRQSWADVGVACAGTQPPPTCDETLTTDSGEIASPNFPNSYPENYSHTICIKPASGNPAVLHFTDFNTEVNNDVVTIHDATGAVVSTTSGTTPPGDTTSTVIAVTFVTDGNVDASGWHATWTVTAMNQAPTVQLTSPADGSTLTGIVTVAADAADADGTISSVRFDLPDGTSQTVTAAPYAVSWASTTVADGAGYTIKATSFDNLGVASTPSTVTVTVSNSVPCIEGTFTAGDVPLAIPDNNSTGITSSVLVNGTGAVGSLQLSLHITHTHGWLGRQHRDVERRRHGVQRQGRAGNLDDACVR